MSVTKVSPLTPIPASIQRSDPELYQYLMRLQDSVSRLVTGVNAVSSSASSTETSVAASLDTKADKVKSASEGHVAILDVKGNLADSGYKASNTPAADVFAISDSSGKLNDWVDIPTFDDFFEIDAHGNLVPSENPTTSSYWELDSSDNIIPKEV